MQPQYMRAFKIDEPAAEAGTPIRFVASTANMGRDGMIIRSDAWNLDNYRRNPVVLWAHDYSAMPIGKAEVMPEEGRLVASVTFDQGDERAREIERKYRDGFLSAVSVGWDTLEANRETVTRAELLDISAVPVPGDPGALIQRQARAFKALSEELEGVMQSGPDGDGQRIGAVLNKRNKDALEQAMELIRGVLDSAKKQDEAEPDADEGDRALKDIAERLQSI